MPPATPNMDPGCGTGQGASRPNLAVLIGTKVAQALTVGLVRLVLQGGKGEIYGGVRLSDV